MSRPAFTGLALALTLAGALGTRLPDGDWPAFAASGLSILLAILWTMSLWRPRPWWPPVAVVLLAGLLALPTSPQAWLASVPAALAAAPAALFLAFVFRSRALDAPHLEGHGSVGLMRRLVRILPVSVALAAVALLPWVARHTLPDRLASSFELQGAFGPLTALVVVATIILGFAWMRDAFVSGKRGTPAPEPEVQA